MQYSSSVPAAMTCKHEATKCSSHGNFILDYTTLFVTAPAARSMATELRPIAKASLVLLGFLNEYTTVIGSMEIGNTV